MATKSKVSKTITITMTDRRPVKIVEAEWPKVAYGEDYSGEHDFQSFDGARVAVRIHADGRSIVYGYAGDWNGGGRTGRENRAAGYLLDAGGDMVAAIRRVAGILADTACVGDLAHAAARRCIADLPGEEV